MTGYAKSALKKILHSIGAEKYFVFIYRKIKYFHSKTSVKLGEISKKFWTTSSELRQRVTNFGWEKPLLEDFINNIRPGDIVWDVGSHIGMYSIFASHVTGTQGSVFAFEPEPICHSFVKKNIQLNHINNITLFDIGLSDTNKKGHIYSSRINHIAIHSIKFEPRLSERGKSVQLRTGDQLILDNIALPPNSIKIDVEGAETKVLAGMKRVLEDPDCRYMQIEIHSNLLNSFGTAIGEIETIIIEAGFDISKKIIRGEEIHWICTKPD